MPTSAEPIVRAYVARVEDVNPRERTMVAKINTGSLDRYRTVIDPRGIDRTNYTRNPVVLWEHGQDPARGAMPIGRNSSIRPAIGPDGPELIAKTQFFEKGKKGDDFTERLWECYRDGDMRAWSVNIIPSPEGCSSPTKDEIRERPELADCWMMYRRSDLAEYSAVAVGGNAEALTCDEARGVLKCISRGLDLPPDLVAAARRLTITIDPAIAARRISRDAEWYLVLADDGSEVGRYRTDDEARAKLTDLLRSAPTEPELPALAGRSYNETLREQFEAARNVFSAERMKTEALEYRDWLQGKV
jgi:hypothetical protein